MRILLFLSDLMIPLLFFYIIGFGLLMKKDIYNDFVTGAFDGLKIVVKIMPTLIGLMTGVGILRASGFLDALASLLEKPPETHRLPLRPGSPLHRKNVLLQRRHQSPPRPLQTTRPRLYHRPDRLPHPQQHRNHLLYPKRLLHSRQSPKPPLHPPRRPPRHPVRNHRQHRHSKPYVNLYSFTFSPGLHKNNHMPIISYLYHQLSQKPLPIQRITHTFSPVLPL